MDASINKQMLELMVSLHASVIFSVDKQGTIQNVFSADSDKQLSRFQGKPFKRLMRLVLQDSFESLWSAYEWCVLNKSLKDVLKIEHNSKRNLTYYFNWHFMYCSDKDHIIVYIENITETLLIEKEFCCVTNQYESVNHELYEAMSKLDLYLMDLEQAHKKLSALYRITSIIQRTLKEEEVLEVIVDGIVKELGHINVYIFMLDNGHQELTVKAPKRFYDELVIPVGEGIVGYAAQHREVIYVPDVSKDLRCILYSADVTSELAIPLIVNDKVIGVLDVMTSHGNILQSYDLDFLRSLGGQIGMLLSHVIYMAKVEKEAITDGLTNLFNYRYFRIVFRNEFKRAFRYRRALALLMIDIDHFKKFNDDFGHQVGDKVLKIVSNIIKKNVREVDFVARYGGEEFAVFLPETSAAEAAIIAERIRSGVAQYSFPYRTINVSIGVADSFGARSDAELIDHADIALYDAKEKSRNIISIYNNLK